MNALVWKWIKSRSLILMNFLRRCKQLILKLRLNIKLVIFKLLRYKYSFGLASMTFNWINKFIISQC